MIADRDLDGLPVRVHYPDAGDGPFPVVIFSHGLGGNKLGYAYLGKLLAEHGYVSIHPSHRESKGIDLDSRRLEMLRKMKEAIDDPRNWEQRPRDVQHVIDRLDALQLRVSLDRGRVGVAGHSYGGYTTLLCAGARLLVDHDLRDFSVTGARAFCAMSPPGNGSRGLGAWSWPHVRGPMLCLTGTLDGGLQGQPPHWREESFDGMAPGDKTLIVLDGAEHFTFSGGRPRKQANPHHLRQIEAAVLWFWDRTLRDIDRPLPALEGARIERK